MEKGLAAACAANAGSLCNDQLRTLSERKGRITYSLNGSNSMLWRSACKERICRASVHNERKSSSSLGATSMNFKNEKVERAVDNT